MSGHPKSVEDSAERKKNTKLDWKREFVAKEKLIVDNWRPEGKSKDNKSQQNICLLSNKKHQNLISCKMATKVAVYVTCPSSASTTTTFRDYWK